MPEDLIRKVAPDDLSRKERIRVAVAGISILLVALISLIGSWQANAELSDQNKNLTKYVQCQAEWNTFLYRALEARTHAGNEATAAMDDLVNAITQAKSPDDTRTALAKYKTARANQIATQQQNPLPPPPNEVCQI